MRVPYRLVVFDWEGTLSDSLGQIIKSLKKESERLGYATFNETLVRQFAELGLTKVVKIVFPSLTSQQQEQLLAGMQSACALRSFDVCLMPGARDVVNQLYQNGIYLAIATNKEKYSLYRALQASTLNTFFSVTRSAGQVPAKPNPTMLVEIMAEFDVKPEETLMIGDSVIDIEMARNVGVAAIGLDFTHQHADILFAAGAEEVFNDFQSLAVFLQLSKPNEGECE